MRVEPVILHPFFTKQVFFVFAVAFAAFALVIRVTRKNALKKI